LIINHADRIQAYDFIYHKFKNKLTTLKANKLNHAGRLAYIQSVFASIPIYYMAHVLLKKNFLQKLLLLLGISGGQEYKKRMLHNLCI